MKGIEILIHAIRMVLGNPGAALRISGVLMAVQFVLIVGLGFQQGFIDGAMMSGRLAQHGTTGPTAGGLLLLLVQGASALWIAVAWHRFVLMEEQGGGVLPPFNAGAILSYLWVAILLGLVLILASIPFMALAWVVAAPFMMGMSITAMLLGGLIFVLIVGLPLAYISFRLSPVLPAAAMQQRIPMSEAWYATGTGGAAFVVLALACAVATWIVYLPVGLLYGVSVFLAFLWAFAAQWVILLVGVSLLTTIYGHYVEKRDLNV